MDVEMPNGDIVEFPDDMPKEQIRAMILKKFPDAARSAGRYDFPGRVMQVGQDIVDLGHGAAQSGAGLVGGMEAIGDLMGLPQGPGHAARREQLEKFAKAPSQSGAQSVGYWGAELAPWLIPGPGWAAKFLEWFGPKAATKALPTVAPSIRGAGGRFMQNPAYVQRKEFLQKIGELGSTLGDVVERSSMGASVGAFQNPEHPWIGAATGAISMGLGPLVGRAVGPTLSWPGQVVTRGAAVTGTGELLHQTTGLPREVTYPMSIGAGVGKAAGAIGGAPGTGVGKLLEKFPPLVGVGTTSTARALQERSEQNNQGSRWWEK